MLESILGTISQFKGVTVVVVPCLVTSTFQEVTSTAPLAFIPKMVPLTAAVVSAVEMVNSELLPSCVTFVQTVPASRNSDIFEANE